MIAIYINLKKEEIDKACKDKHNKYYSPGFKIEIHFVDA